MSQHDPHQTAHPDGPPPARGVRRRRTATSLLCLAVAVGTWSLAPEARAAGNTMWFSGTNGDVHRSYGGNGVVQIDGSITFEGDCDIYGRSGTVDDYIYPTTDVYLVRAGSTAPGLELEDLSGSPNTIVGTGGGSFIGETIAVTTPSGALGDGDYDIVFDTCQDGVFDTTDAVFHDAVHVDVPDGEVPPVDPSLRQMKEAARQQYMSWIEARMGLLAILKIQDAKTLASCLLSPSVMCLWKSKSWLKDYDAAKAKGPNKVKAIALHEMMNQAKHYFGIWQDPADPDFHTLPRAVDPGVAEPAATGDALTDALDATAAPLAAESAMAEQLLHAAERYQGAQQAGDSAWALAQARAVRDAAQTLAAHLRDDDTTGDLVATLRADLDGIVEEAETDEDVLDRLRRNGLTADESRALRNRGMSEADVRALESELVAGGSVSAPDATGLGATLDHLTAARTQLLTAAEDMAAGWADHVQALEKVADQTLPVADAGPATRTDDTGLVHLDATSSRAGRDGAKLTTFDWDTDGDGAYDDAHGSTADVHLATSRAVALRVTDADGKQAVDTVHVHRAGADRAPVITSSSPAPAAVVTAGDSATFTVQATDPDGDALHYTWTYGGEPVGGDSPSYTLPTSQVGAAFLQVEVTGARRSAMTAWTVTVTGTDADGDGWAGGAGGPDCDDTRTDVHPQGLERFGNGLDDDCDPGTPDGPVGGLRGTVRGWGIQIGVGRPPVSGGADYTTPVDVPALGDDVRSVQSTHAGGFATVGDEGAAWAWGRNFGQVGDGTYTDRYTPVPVLGVGGAAGSRLTGVAELASQSDHVLARLGGGTLVAWGSNVNRQLGSGDSVSTRLYPVKVLDAAGQQVSDAVSVETGENTSLAVTRDGHVRQWGVVACDGDNATTTVRGAAVVNPVLGDHVVQVASASGGTVLVRRADGSLQSCSGNDYMLGRDHTIQTVNVPGTVKDLGSGVVDVSVGSSSVVALKEDGSVWTWGRNLNHVLDVLGLPPGGEATYPTRVPLPAGPPVIAVDTDDSTAVHALRADGSVLSWGGDTYSNTGTGRTSGVGIPAPEVLDLGGRRAISLTSANWNGMALTRPALDPDFEPAVQWVHASLADATVTEGDGGTARLTLTVGAPRQLDVRYRVGDGPVREATVPAGATIADLPVGVVDDPLDEDDETVPMTVVSVSDGVVLDRETATLTVTDDDAAPVASIGSATVQEGDTSLRDVLLPLTLDGPSGKDATVDWTATADGREVTHGTVVLAAGETKAEVHVPLVGDTAPGADRSVDVAVTGTDNARVGHGGTVTVTDDDPLALHVTGPAGPVAEGDAGTTDVPVEIGVDQAVPAGETLRVPWAVQAGTAEVGPDVLEGHGTVVLDSTHPTATVTVQVVGDRAAEPLDLEVLSVAVDAAGVTESAGRRVLPPSASTVSVRDDDAGPTVGVDGPVTLDEGGTVPIHGESDAPVTWSVDVPGCSVAEPHALDTTLTCRRDGAGELSLTADDGVNPAATTGTTVQVANLAPGLTVVSPADGATVSAGSPVTLTATATDAGPDDAVTCTVAWGDGSGDQPAPGCSATHTFTAAGTPRVTVTARDGDGGVTTRQVGLDVRAAGPAYPFDGFYAPVDNPDVVNVVKAGSAVPVKFSLGGYRGMDVLAAGSPASGAHRCDATDPSDALEETAQPGAASLSYDSGTGRYQYVWKTPKTWSGTCRTLVVTLVDGRSRTAEFRFR